MKQIPRQIAGANVIAWLVLNSKNVKTGNTEHIVSGQTVDNIYGLAICKYDLDSGYYLFYCNPDWVEFTDTYHNTVEDAINQAEFEFSHTNTSWTFL